MATERDEPDPLTLQLLRLTAEWGGDECIVPAPINRLHPQRKPVPHFPPSEKIGSRAVALMETAISSPLPRAAIAAAQELGTGDAPNDLYAELMKISSLEALRAFVHQYNECPLKKKATHTVFGEGNPNAAIMFVGEAPGAEEDRQGRPFVGQSGRLLDLMLSYIQLDRNQFYITNTVYWRPPQNRAPTSDELATSLPLVEKHISLIKPHILVAVGGVAAQALFQKKDGIMRLHGVWTSYRNRFMAAAIPATAIYHPAFLLRQPARKRECWQDLLGIEARLKARD